MRRAADQETVRTLVTPHPNAPALHPPASTNGIGPTIHDKPLYVN
jgi:hypothetical protein